MVSFQFEDENMSTKDIRKLILENRISYRILTAFNSLYKFLSNFKLFLATSTGYIPSHAIRNMLYRKFFKVDLSPDSIIYWKCMFFEPVGVTIGHNSIIGNNAFLDGRYGLYIGNNVNISAEVRIFTVEHDIEDPDFRSVGNPVFIEDWSYIGTRVTILPGVKIGKGAVVASGAVVTKNVEPWTMVGGVPAKFIKNRPQVKYTLNTSKKMFFQ